MMRSDSYKEFGLRDLPEGIYFSSIDQIVSQAKPGKMHYMKRAFREMELDGILCIDDTPTVYFKNYKTPLEPAEASYRHKQFWNQSTANILILQDPNYVHVFSGQMPPGENGKIDDHSALIDKWKRVADTLEHHHFIEQLSSGHYYRLHSAKFDPKGTVDRYLINNLRTLCRLLAHEDTVRCRKAVNAFVGQIIFACYLVDREIIRFSDYSFIPSPNRINDLKDLFVKCNTNQIKDFLNKLFSSLRDDFNGSLFEGEFEDELGFLSEGDCDYLRHFFQGRELETEITGQLTLGFWAYDFSIIPVETISAIYEELLAFEDIEDKKSKGAFYTPRHLAEMVVEEAVSSDPTILGKTFLDPSCGSGIFLVVLFNRMVDEWRQMNEGYDEKSLIGALGNMLKNNIHGVDVNQTACRIACFSLYVAFLDQFDPPYLQGLQNKNGKFLEKLLAYQDEHWSNVENPSVFEGNFFDPELPVKGEYDFVIGNPPWSGRNKSVEDKTLEKWLSSDNNPWLGKVRKKSQLTKVFYPGKQVAHAFMWKVPIHLRANGKSCLLLPSEILLNRTDKFQELWFQSVTVGRIIHLADFRRLLFENAIHPCFIIDFNCANKDSIDEIEYVTPKFAGIDPGTGVVQILPDDRKWIPINQVIEEAQKNRAAILWKKYYTGTSRDRRLIDSLMTLPPLSEIAGSAKAGKRWVTGKGFKPWYQAGFDKNPDTYGFPKPIPGELSDPFYKTSSKDNFLFVLPSDCIPLREHLETVKYKDKSIPDEDRDASLEGFHRSPDKNLFNPPLVLINKGFSKFLYSDTRIFYQDLITGISGPESDSSLLLFLMVFVQSNLAAYYLYHTTGCWGTERTQIHLHELLRLPFPLPGAAETHPGAARIVSDVAAKLLALKKELKALSQQIAEESAGKRELKLRSNGFDHIRRKRTETLKKELEHCVYQYFDLSEEDIALIEDTCNIYEKSATPPKYNQPVPTTRKSTLNDKRLYASWLCRTLNAWSGKARQNDSKPSFCFSSQIALMPEIDQVLVTLCKSGKETEPKGHNGLPEDLIEIFSRIARASRTRNGTFEYSRGVIFADKGKSQIHILKPDLLGRWTRTAALNDSQDIFDAITSGGLK